MEIRFGSNRGNKSQGPARLTKAQTPPRNPRMRDQENTLDDAACLARLAASEPNGAILPFGFGDQRFQPAPKIVRQKRCGHEKNLPRSPSQRPAMACRSWLILQRPLSLKPHRPHKQRQGNSLRREPGSMGDLIPASLCLFVPPRSTCGNDPRFGQKNPHFF